MSPRVRSLLVFLVGGAVLAFAADVVVRTPGFLVPRDFLEYWAAGRVNLRGGNPYHPDELHLLAVFAVLLVADAVTRRGPKSLAAGW